MFIFSDTYTSETESHVGVNQLYYKMCCELYGLIQV